MISDKMSAAVSIFQNMSHRFNNISFILIFNITIAVEAPDDMFINIMFAKKFSIYSCIFWRKNDSLWII